MISGIITAVLLVAFIGISLWAYSSRQRERFAEAAQLPLRDEPPPASCCNQWGRTPLNCCAQKEPRP